MPELLFLIPLLPFLGAAVCGLLGGWLGRRAVHLTACAAVLTAFVMAVVAARQLPTPITPPAAEGAPLVSMQEGPELTAAQGLAHEQTVWDWITVGTGTDADGGVTAWAEAMDIGLTLRVDALSALLILIVTGVGFLIHLYSIGYMRDDPDYARYFCYLNLFTGMMLVLVMGGNLPVMFIGWEGVGLCSYLLIGFWYKDHANATAGRKAFIVNRVGDFCFLLGMFLLFWNFGTLDFQELRAAVVGQGEAGSSLLTAIGLLLFGGATGKSAQIPLYVWLPDAMAGPTPVSALIHAATMVTAGVYMVARMGFLYTMAPVALATVAIVGAVTALFAATMALTATDIKKVLAYSTISQLGYMFLGVGSGLYFSGVFHLATHAFFKALLFLGAGAVIVAMHHEQDLRKMGGLIRKLPITGWTFVIATAAIAGLPGLSGFWSKEEILGATLAGAHMHEGTGWVYILCWMIALFTAGLTAFYMTRCCWLAFFGSPRDQHAYDHATEQPWTMTVPLVVLAVLSVAGSWVVGDLAESLRPVTGTVNVHELHHEFHPWWGMTLAILAFLCGVGAALGLYGFLRLVPAGDDQPVSRPVRVLRARWWVDEVYTAIFVRGGEQLAAISWNWIDNGIVDWLVDEVGEFCRSLSRRARRLQTGYFGTYAFAMGGGAAVLLVVLMMYFIGR